MRVPSAVLLWLSRAASDVDTTGLDAIIAGAPVDLSLADAPEQLRSSPEPSLTALVDAADPAKRPPASLRGGAHKTQSFSAVETRFQRALNADIGKDTDLNHDEEEDDIIEAAESGHVLPREPNYKGITTGIMVNNRYEKSMLLAASAVAVKATLKKQAGPLATKFRRIAHAAALRSGQATFSIAPAVAARTFSILGKTVVQRASKQCALLSRNPSLPAICRERAARFWKKFRPAGMKQITKKSAAMAYPLVVWDIQNRTADLNKGLDMLVTHTAFNVAARSFDKLYSKYVQDYAVLEEKSAARMVEERHRFWAAAKKDMERQLNATVVAALYGKPWQDARKQIQSTALRQARRTSGPLVQQELQAHLQKAADRAVVEAAKLEHKRLLHRMTIVNPSPLTPRQVFGVFPDNPSWSYGN